MSTATSSHPDFADEQAFLRHAYTCLREMRQKMETLGDAGGDKKASAALAKLQQKMLEQLNDPNSICFGRLDFETGDRHYVGRQLIQNDRYEPVVINWAAPAAAPFYEASPEDPMELLLRRRFRTEGERLLGISDDVFAAGASVEPAIGDILLEELARERTAEMREIAATIQRDQYAIISRPLESTTVVQGGPGTGKTAVGLHRAALLLFRHRNELVSSRVMVVGPNRLFMQYIAYVLPSLGETAAVQVAVDELGGIDALAADDDLVARVKGDERMAEVLRRAVVERVRVPNEKIELSAHGVRFSLTPADVAAAVGHFDATSSTYVNARLQFRGELERRAAAAYARARTSSDAPSAVSPRQIPEFERALDRIWPTITAPELVRQLLSSEERLEVAGRDFLTEAERRLLYRKPVERLEQVVWSSSDVPLVDEVQELIDPSARRAGHLILDEAQDLTPMQLRMVGRRIRNGAATILGDLAQTTGLWSYPNWSVICGHLGLQRAEVEELTLAYRVPRQIMEVALPSLELTAPSIRPPEAFRDGEEEPAFVEVAGEERARRAVDTAVAMHAAGGTAAIVAASSCLHEIRGELDRRGCEFGDATRGELSAAIDLLHPVASKGLEFDHVVIVEPGAIIREASEGKGHQELYVALTRAMRTLTCFHTEPLPWPLNARSAPKQLDAKPTAPEPAAEPAHVGAITIGEALSIALMRGLPLERVLARGLLRASAGGDEAAVVSAVLATNGADADADELVRFARQKGAGGS